MINQHMTRLLWLSWLLVIDQMWLSAAVVTTMPYHEASFDPALSEILKAINFSMSCSLAMVQFNSYKETMAKELYFAKST